MAGVLIAPLTRQESTMHIKRLAFTREIVFAIERKNKGDVDARSVNADYVLYRHSIHG